MNKNKITLTSKDIRNNKMSKEELETHQHVARKGGVRFKSKKDYRRHPKHKNNQYN